MLKPGLFCIIGAFFCRCFKISHIGNSDIVMLRAASGIWQAVAPGNIFICAGETAMKKSIRGITVLFLMCFVFCHPVCAGGVPRTAALGMNQDFAEIVRENREAVQAFYPLSTVKNVKVVLYSQTALKIRWAKTDGAVYYKVYRCREKNGTYKLIATTKRLSYINRGLEENTRYYYKVQACLSKKASEADSRLSEAVSKTTRDYQRVTVFAGDSLMTGISIYDLVKDIDIGGKKKVVAYKGLSTVTFRTKSVFHGKTGVEKVISYQPYRAYIMLGMNDIAGQKPSQVIAHYRKLIQRIQKESPDTELVLLAVSPVSKSVQTRRKGFQNIPALNEKISALAEEFGLEYYDYTADYKNDSGTLNKYNSGDGIHWSAKGYAHFADILETLDKQLDP